MDDKTKDKDKKKNQNRLTYVRNRALILNRARERYQRKKVIPFPLEAMRGNLPELVSEMPQNRKTSARGGKHVQWGARLLVEQALIFSVILLSTYFLLRETVAFLSQTEGTASAWLKALVGEGLVISLSAMRFTCWHDKAAKATLLLVLFGYNAVAIVGGLWTQGQTKMTQSTVARQTVFEIETEIQKKEVIRVAYVDRGSDALARKYDRQIDSLREKLALARAEMLKHPSAENTRTTFSVLAFFRLIVLLGNSFLVAHFSAFFRHKPNPVLRLQVC